LLKATDSDLTSYIFGTPVDFTITFGNDPIQNGTGADFVIFEPGSPDDVSVTVGSTTKTYLTQSSDFTADGFNLNEIASDLSDFGIGANSLVSTFEVNNTSPVTGSASICAIGALNTVPEPGTLLLLGSGLVGLGSARARRQRVYTNYPRCQTMRPGFGRGVPAAPRPCRGSLTRTVLLRPNLAALHRLGRQLFDLRAIS
jgi:hypothetical protein